MNLCNGVKLIRVSENVLGYYNVCGETEHNVLPKIEKEQFLFTDWRPVMSLPIKLLPVYYNLGKSKVKC